MHFPKINIKVNCIYINIVDLEDADEDCRSECRDTCSSEKQTTFDANSQLNTSIDLINNKI